MAKTIKRMKRCNCCGEEKDLNEFYKSQSPMYKADNKLPICKNCMLNIYEENLQYYKDMEKALYKTLFSLDIYFDLKFPLKQILHLNTHDL